jgi:hypothetical protein
MRFIFITFIYLVISSFCLAQNDIFSILKEVPKITIAYTDSISNSPKDLSFKLSSENWESIGFNKIEDFNSIFNYSIYGYLLKDSLVVLFLERWYVDESLHWACLYKENKLIDWLEISYDNSEGFIYIVSEIKQYEIIKKTWNIYTNPIEKSLIYQIKSNGFIKK